MGFRFLEINDLRNLAHVRISPAEGFNLLYGLNGSGKTSFFEAIYYLLLGRSFRTRHTKHAITHGLDRLSVFAKIYKEDELISVGIERQSNGKNQLRINKENQTSMLEAAKILPIQLLNPESRHLLIAPSKVRRAFIDWGVFHVEPAFVSPWQQAQRILKQRNAALKSGASKEALIPWNIQLLKVTDLLDSFRRNYLTALEPILFEILRAFFGETFNFSFKYKPGWDEQEGLLSALERTYPRDVQLGYTQRGPHRTDLLIRVDDALPAQEVLSQGQQKILVYALHLAQGILLKQQTGKRCVFLLDDLSAELDHENQQKVVKVLHGIDAQVFITSIHRDAGMQASFREIRTFHVERGEILSL